MTREIIYINVPDTSLLNNSSDPNAAGLLEEMTNPERICYGKRIPRETVDWLLSLCNENTLNHLCRCYDEKPDVYAITYDNKNLEIVVWNHGSKNIWGVVLSKLENKPNRGVRVFRGDPIIFYFPLDHLIDSVQDAIIEEVYTLHPNARAPEVTYETKV